MLALNASDIISLVGIWGGNNSVWILRKHPGLAMLTPEECGIEESDGGEGEINEGMEGSIQQGSKVQAQVTVATEVNNGPAMYDVDP